jgi:hypothetical protein
VVSSTPRPHLPPGKEPPVLTVEGWVGPRAGLDADGRGKILPRGSNSFLINVYTELVFRTESIFKKIITAEAVKKFPVLWNGAVCYRAHKSAFLVFYFLREDGCLLGCCCTQPTRSLPTFQSCLQPLSLRRSLS